MSRLYFSQEFLPQSTWTMIFPPRDTSFSSSLLYSFSSSSQEFTPDFDPLSALDSRLPSQQFTFFLRLPSFQHLTTDASLLRTQPSVLLSQHFISSLYPVSTLFPTVLFSAPYIRFTCPIILFLISLISVFYHQFSVFQYFYCPVFLLSALSASNFPSSQYFISDFPPLSTLPP